MQPYIDVRFSRCAEDRSLVSSVHHWVARFAAMHLEVCRAGIAIEAASRRTTGVSLTLTLVDGQSATAATLHADPYVAVSDAFRAARHWFLGNGSIAAI